MAETSPHYSSQAPQTPDDLQHDPVNLESHITSDQPPQLQPLKRRGRRWPRRQKFKNRDFVESPKDFNSFGAAPEISHVAQPRSGSLYDNRSSEELEDNFETKIRSLLTSSLHASCTQTATSSNLVHDTAMAPNQPRDHLPLYLPPHLRWRQTAPPAASVSDVLPHLRYLVRNGQQRDAAVPSRNPANSWDSALPDPTRPPLPEAKTPGSDIFQDTRAANGNSAHDASLQNTDGQHIDSLGGDLVATLRRSLEESSYEIIQKGSNSEHVQQPISNTKVDDSASVDEPLPVKVSAKTPDELSVATQLSSAPVEMRGGAPKRTPREPATRRPQQKEKASKQKEKASKWIKDRDLKPRPVSPVTNIWASVGGKEEPVNSFMADNGWGGVAKRDHYNQDYTLQDWDGNWAPAPVDWEERGCFKDRAWGERIHKWLGDSAIVPHDVIDMKLEGFDSEETSDLAPKPWIPEHIDGIPVHLWWVQHLKSPLYDGPPDAKPWWHQYCAPESQVLTQLSIPDTKGTDPKEESDFERSRRLKDAGSGAVSRNFQAKVAAKEEERQERRAMARRSRAEFRKREEERKRNPKPFYLRPVLAVDIPSVTDIYNQHLQTTVHCPEDKPLTQQEMSARIDTIRYAALPFIVAVERPKVVHEDRGRKLQRNNTAPFRDKVLGIAYAKEYKEGSHMFRHTFILEIYVDPIHYKKQVGDALMDRINIALAPMCHFPRTDYDFFNAVGPPYDTGGPPQICGYILVQMQYMAHDNERLEWMSKWLAKWEFEQVGIYKTIGVKMGERVNLALFQKTTLEHIDLR